MITASQARGENNYENMFVKNSMNSIDRIIRYSIHQNKNIVDFCFAVPENLMRPAMRARCRIIQELIGLGYGVEKLSYTKEPFIEENRKLKIVMRIRISW